jgi:hypothetical protein
MGDVTSTVTGTTAPFSAIRGISSLTTPAPSLIGRVPNKRLRPSCTLSCAPSAGAGDGAWAVTRPGAASANAAVAVAPASTVRREIRMSVVMSLTLHLSPHAERRDRRSSVSAGC